MSDLISDNIIDVHVFKQMLLNACDEIVKNEPYLTEIDTIIGDGDHGFGMKQGFSKLKVLLLSNDYKTIYELLKDSGINIVKTMGGASGVIFGTMFIGGISNLDPLSRTIGTKEFANFFDDGKNAIEKRGKAKEGQKTMLDALVPAVNAMKEVSNGSNCNFKNLLSICYENALIGVENSKNIESKVGRSKNFGNTTLGIPDPGAVSTSLIFKAFYKTIK